MWVQKQSPQAHNNFLIVNFDMIIALTSGIFVIKKENGFFKSNIFFLKKKKHFSLLFSNMIKFLINFVEFMQ